MFLGYINLNVNIKGTPKFLKDILNNMFGRTDKILNNPFGNKAITDSFSRRANVTFEKIYFVRSYDYSSLKKKKKGKPKRKISKKILKLNNIID